jgi:hypothetical protein
MWDWTYGDLSMGYAGYGVSMSDYPTPTPDNIESPGRLADVNITSLWTTFPWRVIGPFHDARSASRLTIA